MERAKKHELSSRYQLNIQRVKNLTRSAMCVNDCSKSKAQDLREELTGRNTLSSANTSPSSPFRETDTSRGSWVHGQRMLNKTACVELVRVTGKLISSAESSSSVPAEQRQDGTYPGSARHDHLFLRLPSISPKDFQLNF